MSEQFILDDGNQFLFTGDYTEAQSVFNAPLLNIFVKASIGLRKISDGTITTIDLCNREVLTDLDLWPLLRRIDNVGSRNGEYLPELSRSAFTIKNTPHSFGVERKFSDLLDRYSLIESSVIIYVANLPLGDETLENGDFTEVWRSIITDYKVENDEVRVGMTRAVIPARIATKIVDRKSFPDAPNESLGKAIPIIFSDSDEFIEVSPVLISTRREISDYPQARYAFCTTFGTQYKTTGADSDVRILTQNREGAWQQATFDTVPLGFPVADASFKNGWGTVKEYGYGLLAGQNCEGGEMLVACDWFLTTTANGTTMPAGTYSYKLKVYSSQNGYPGQLLASDTLTQADTSRFGYIGNNLAGVPIFQLSFLLDKHVLIPLLDDDVSNSAIFFTMSRSDTGNAFSLLQEGVGGGSVPTYEKYVLADTTAGLDNNFRKDVVSEARDHFQLKYVTKTSTAESYSVPLQDGLSHASFSLTMTNEDLNIDLTKIKLIVQARGIKDDSSGTITGTPSASLSTPLHQARLLLMEYNGSSWVDTVFDETKFSATHSAYGSTGRWKIRTGGATQGRVTVASILDELMRCGNSRIVSFVSGNAKVLGLYAHGSEIDNSFLIDDEKATFQGYQVGGVETILNKVQIAYGRTIQTRLESLLSEGGLQNYTGVIESTSDLMDVPYADVAKSIELFGNRPLDNINYNFINNEQTALSVGSYLLRRFNFPSIEIFVEVPYSEYQSLQVMDVGFVKMVSLPDYYGTSHDPMLPSIDSGLAFADASKGHYLKRYKSYRVQLENNDMIFSDGTALKRILTFRLISAKDIA